MAKFKDKTTGTVIEFLEEHDIAAMRQHPEYDEVEEGVDNIKEETEKKKAGRPKKESE